MKKRIIGIFAACIYLLACNGGNKNTPLAEEYVVNKAATSCACIVQNTKERPQVGKKHLGPFKTVDAATKAMCADIDESMSDPNHCWETTDPKGCKGLMVADITAKEKDVQIFYPVTPIRQPKTNACWAAALTMLYSFKNNMSISIEDLIKQYNHSAYNYTKIFNDNNGISSSAEEKLYQLAKLTVLKQQNPQISLWHSLLKNYGPLSVTVDAEPPLGTTHALVLNGIEGDLTPNGTIILYIDPADGKQHSIKFPDFLNLYEGSAKWPLQVIYYPK